MSGVLVASQNGNERRFNDIACCVDAEEEQLLVLLKNPKVPDPTVGPKNKLFSFLLLLFYYVS